MQYTLFFATRSVLPFRSYINNNFGTISIIAQMWFSPVRFFILFIFLIFPIDFRLFFLSFNFQWKFKCFEEAAVEAQSLCVLLTLFALWVYTSAHFFFSIFLLCEYCECYWCMRGRCVGALRALLFVTMAFKRQKKTISVYSLKEKTTRWLFFSYFFVFFHNSKHLMKIVQWLGRRTIV